jgi:phthalate 4,5-dioxygenase
MLKREDNELITRVGPGTPMGDTLRRYWMPALLSSEVPHPDSDPVRVRLLGEDLIAFRDTNGSVGLLQNNCPHRVSPRPNCSARSSGTAGRSSDTRATPS